jgi:hypothetical protein
MSIFNYVLPSGSEFRLEASGTITKIEADRIFYEQVAAGSLIGYTAGQTLTSAETRLTKFELSRLDRGTAGVDNLPVLVFNQGIASTTSDTAPILATLLSLPVPVSVPNLSNVLLTDPIDEADVVTIKGDDLAPVGIGANGVRALNPYQIQKLLAQIANLVDQESDQISVNKGIGRYGFTAYQLELAGYVKPGTTQRYFIDSNADFVSIMSSPSVWTGRGGVYALNDLLLDPLLQNQIQVQIMQQNYNNLLSAGVIVTPVRSSVSVSSGQVYTNTGLQSTRALATLGILGTNLSDLTANQRSNLLNSPNISRLLNATNVDLNTIASGAVNSLSTGLSRLGNLSQANFASAATALSNQITGSVGALVANASKYGTQATAIWSRAVNIQNLDFNSIKANLTNLVPPTLSGLNSGLDVLGKAGSFATNFANPLSGLNNVDKLLTSGGGIGGALTTQVGNLTGQLSNLPGQIAGQLGNLGNLTNIGSLGNLFGRGGDLVSGTRVAAGFNNTVNRATVDAAFQRVLGSAKIPLPVFQYPSPASLAPRLDIQFAQNFLKTLQTQGQAAATQASAIAGRFLG